MSKEIAKQNDAAVADFLASVTDAGYDGFENVDQKLIELPFLKYAQPTSSELLEGAGQIDGLKPGHFFNKITGRVYGPEVLVIPLGFDATFLEWDESDGNGKLCGRYKASDIAQMIKDGVVTVEEGYKYTRKGTNHKFADTQTFFVMLPEYVDDGIMMLSFKSKGLRHVRKWMTKIRAMRWTLPDGKTVPAPMFGCVWSLKTMLNKNDKGSFYLLGDDKIMTAQRVGDLLDDKWNALQKTVLEAASYVKDIQFKVNVVEKDVTGSVKDDGIPF
jgi:hypothetical protein